MHYALTQNHIVTQILRVPPESVYGLDFAAQFTPVSEDVKVGWLSQNGKFLAPPSAPLTDRQIAAWERIKTERDRRKSLGVKVGTHWFHSDDPSRVQQLALAMMGAAIPAGLQWKTLTLTPDSVFVEMTPALAQSIFQATAASDTAIFAAAETHRLAMEASGSPESYDCNAGWPASIEDEQGA